ncbi:S8 family serine peptidase [Chloroflexales bacterium ZM16-3]|nr:S8 family serine peptidase [Chloroflexales bacterium ZM16-3]
MLRKRSNAALSLLSILVVFGFLFAGAPQTQAQGGRTAGNLTATPLDASALEGVIESSIAKSDFADADMVSLLIKIADAPLATYDGSIPGLAATSPKVTGVSLDVSSPASQAYLAYINGKLDALVASLKASIPAATVTHRYDVVLGGVAVRLPRILADRLAHVSGVSTVIVDQVMKIDTYRSPAFIGATTAWAQGGGQEQAGEGVIVGILDSGIWPENASYADPDPSGKPYAAPRPRTDGTPWPCDFSGGDNPGAPFSCNNKLISAQRFMGTYENAVSLAPDEFTSARDDDGHGTHTSSTAAGNSGVPVSLLGNNLGTISGIAPRAQIVAYKVCGELGCYGTDSAAAVQQAIIDGVDVLNFSISGGENPFSDAVEEAFRDAYDAGIFVSASAGNSGPTPDTVAHRGPWTMTVAASTIDRSFQSTATLTASDGANLSIVGDTLTKGVSTPADVVVNTADPLCQSPAATGSFVGQIVLCQRGVNARVEKSANVAAGGAVGMFLFNTVAQGTNTDLHSIPSIHFEGGPGSAGEQLVAFMAAHASVTATFTDGAPAMVQGDVMAGFSSRGGNGQTLGISKPDITGPGVNVLAAYTGSEYGVEVPIYNFLSGTSMSSPHMAGSGALIKWLHPDWTPGQIKSALMTTAIGDGVVKEDGVTPADAYDMGSGRVNLAKAFNPGITFDETGDNFIALQDHLWDANYPSLFVPTMPGTITVRRTAKNVLSEDTEWRMSVETPAGQAKDFTVSFPREFKVKKNRSASFSITIDGRDVPLGETRFATIIFKGERGRSLRFPVTFIRKQAPVTLDTSCDPASFPQNSSADCTITLVNTTFNPASVSVNDLLPSELRVDRRSVVGGRASGNRVTFSGTLAGAEPAIPSLADVYFGSPAGYLPLSLFTGNLVIPATDESISNVNVPSFVFGGETYSRIGVVSNGYLVVGGGTGADVSYINQILPDSTPPNNVLAPFWTDLNPEAGGTVQVNVLGDSVNSWIVVEYSGVKEYSTATSNSFQVWIGLNGVEDISYVYDALEGNGDGGFLTVGVENRFGNRGENYYADGAGTLPTNTTELIVSSVPGAPGETHTISFSVEGRKAGTFVNYPAMTSDSFYGTSTGRFAGEVTRSGWHGHGHGH